MKNFCFIDLFAGAGGLSEGFIREGFKPIAHVEMNERAANTLKTRTTYHYLNKNDNIVEYLRYLKKEITKEELWGVIPRNLLNSIINIEINKGTIESIFNDIDILLDGKKADVIVGGPPCQAYSLVGRSRDPNRMKGDKRNYLFRFYVEFLKKYKPRYFVFENVLGLLSAGLSYYFNSMLQLFEENGYSTDFKILNAADCGVLQNRQRVAIIGRRGKIKFKFPEIAKMDNKWEIKKDLFYDLPNLIPGQVMEIAEYQKSINEYLKLSGIRNCISFTTQHITRHHNQRDLEIYSIAIDKWLNKGIRLKYNELPEHLLTHNKRDIFLDRFKVINPTGHSHTIMAHLSKDGHYYIYPDLKQIRSISVREAARIQSFPDDYYFEGGRTAAFNQIGNAVPPLMAQAIAKTMISLL